MSIRDCIVQMYCYVSDTFFLPPPNPTLQKESTQILPASTEAVLEVEGQTGSKGS